MRGNRAIATLAFAALLAPAATMAWMARDLPHLGYFQDDALYLIGAKSLAEGHGYRILSLPGQPFQTKYPPLYSWLLLAAPANWQLLVSWLWLPAYLLLARRVAPEAPLWLMSLSPALIFLSINLLPEFLFASLAFGCLLAAERAGGKSHPSRWAVAGGLLAGCAWLAKSAALALVPAVVIWLFVRRQPRRAALFLAGMLPAIAGWNAWVYAHKLHTTDIALTYYTDYLGFYLRTASADDLPRIVLTNAASLVRTAGSLVVFHPGESIWAMLFSALVVGIALIGVRREWSLYALFCACYGLLLLIWNFPPNERFLLPVLPLLAAGFWATLRRLPGFRIVAVALAAFLLWVTFQTLPPILEVQRARRRDLAAAFRAIREQCSGAVVAYQDTLVYLNTGKPALRLVVPSILFYRGDNEALWALFRKAPEFAREHGATCLLSARGDYHTDAVISDDAMREEILSGNPELSTVFRRDGARVFRIR